MSGTMSSTNNQWQHLYQNNQPTMVQTWSSDDGATNATTNTNTNTTNTNTSISNQLSRVTRPTNTRRRSRASRRTPTTLLNTDTTNFRAMVQRFTGGGNAGGDPVFLSNESSVSSTNQFLNPYNSSISTSFNDGVGLINSGVVPRVNEGYNMQFQPPHSQPYFTMTADDGGSTSAVHDGDNEFRQRGPYM
ncbi:uncharacterized protein [Rutidosis leptorrhynchoides]|uniref:uncharacterized protein n=1 Tax=Rutidosis leptorrhynchoides TaxID=125765 RepID=UPI003A9971F6